MDYKIGRESIKKRYTMFQKIGITLRWRHNEMASEITSLTIVYSTVYSDADQSRHQSSASLAFVWGIHRGPVNSPHKWPVTRKMFPFDDVIMKPFCVKCHYWLIMVTSWHKSFSYFWPFNFFDVSLNKLLNAQSICQWSETSWPQNV